MDEMKLRTCHACGVKRPVIEMAFVEVRIYSPGVAESGFCCVGECSAKYLRSIADAVAKTYEQRTVKP